MDSWVVTMCRRVAARRLAVWGALLLAGIAYCLSNSRYISNFVNGPFAMSESDLLQVGTAPHYFVRVSGTKTVDTGVQEFSIEKQNGREVSRRVSAMYYALIVGEHWLIVKSDSGMVSSVEGSLEGVSPDLHAQVFSTPEDREIVDVFYPFYLDSTGFRYAGYYGIAIGAVFLVILAICATPTWKWFRDTLQHPVMQRVQKWGGLESVCIDVDQEYKNHTRIKQGAFVFTNKYLIEKTFFRFNVLRMEDLVWAYKRTTQKRIYYVIPAGKYYHAILIFYEGSAQVPGTEQDVNGTIAWSASKAPWAVVGYSKELEELFKSQTADFCAAVEARRQGIKK